MIVIHSNFLSAMHGFRDNDVLCQPDMTSSSVLRQETLHAIFHDGFWKSDHDFQIAFHSNFLSGMDGFRDNNVYCKPDMTSSWFLRQGVLHANFLDVFRISDHDFLIAFHSNFLSAMHGFYDNDVLLQAGDVVIMISPPGGAPRDFSWRILKERPWLPDSVL